MTDGEARASPRGSNHGSGTNSPLPRDLQPMTAAVKTHSPTGITDDDPFAEDDEDEEIDSDEAFEESDEERFAEFEFKKKVRIYGE